MPRLTAWFTDPRLPHPWVAFGRPDFPISIQCASLLENHDPIVSVMNPSTLIPTETITQFQEALKAVSQALYQENRAATHHELRQLNELLFVLDEVGVFDASGDPKYQKAMTQFNEFMRATIVAHVQQNLPNPPHWAQQYPDPKRVRKHIIALEELASKLGQPGD